MSTDDLALDPDLLRDVARANINSIDIFDDVVQICGTRNDADEIAAQFPTPSAPNLARKLAKHFGVDIDDVIDTRKDPR